MAIVESLIHNPVLGAAAVLLLLYAALFAARSSARNLPPLPWKGKTSQWPGASVWTWIKGFTNLRSWMTEGYQQYSQHGKAYILPDVSGINHIFLPNDRLSWLLESPDHVLSTGESHYDSLSGRYAFTDPSLLKILYHEHVLHKNLVRKLKDLIPATWEETIACFDLFWGTDTDNWRDICVFDSMADISDRTSNRIVVGFPLCREEGFLKAMRGFATDVINCMIPANLVPKVLKPLLMPLVALPNHYHAWKGSQYAIPLIEKRIVAIRQKDEKPDSDVVIPEDYITWHIRLAKEENLPQRLEPTFIARCLLAVEFAVLHTTQYTASMLILDILGSDHAREAIEGLREEAERVFREENGVWSKQALNRLVRADSALRESLRVSSMMPYISRKVVAPDGVRYEEEGWTAPYGSTISINAADRQFDPDIYANSNEYDAFRFSRSREAYEASHTDKRNSEEWLKLQNMSVISTGKDFLPFGHGRHACPGRFFIQQELKMYLAYIVMNYDLQPLPKRQPMPRVGLQVIPPVKAKIQIRRRRTGGTS